MLSLSSTWAHEAELSLEAGILEIWDTTVPIVSGTCVDAVCSSIPQHGLGEPVSVPRCCTSTYYFADGPYGLVHGSRARTRLSSWDLGDPRACLHCDTTD